jgi:hypothetical protein
MWIGKASSLGTLYQYPVWYCINTPFHKFPYENKIHSSDRLILEWIDIPEITYYGRDEKWISIVKSEWKNPQKTNIISHSLWKHEDPYYGVLKIWRGVGMKGGKRFAIPEGRLLSIVF